MTELTATELSAMQTLLETLRAENEADLANAKDTMAVLAADHSAIDPALLQ